MNARICIRLATLAFGLFIIAAVVIANRGEGSSWWPFLHRIPYGDKLGHIGLFGTLSFLCNLAFPAFRLRFLPRFITATTFALLILISLEEIAQAFIPFRSCDLIDWLADLIGLSIGQFAAITALHLGQRKKCAHLSRSIVSVNSWPHSAAKPPDRDASISPEGQPPCYTGGDR